MPRVILLRKDGEMAPREATYVDDTHVSGRKKDGERATRGACHQIMSRMNSYGNQADAKKWCVPTGSPGAWNGAIMHTYTPFPMQSTAIKKW